MSLQLAHYEAINQQIEKHLKNIGEGQLSITLSQDMREFKKARLSLDDFLHPAFDIDISSIPDGLGRWVAVKDSSTQNILGVAAVRLFENEDVPHLLHARLIWGDREHPLCALEPLSYSWDPALNNLRGKLAFGGGVFLDRRLKGQGVGQAMVAVLHAVCLRLWQPDYFFNIMAIEKVSAKVNPRYFGYFHSTVIYDEHTKPSHGPTRNACEVVNWKSWKEELSHYAVN